MSRAYVISQKVGHGVIDSFSVTSVKSNKKLAIEACEGLVPDGIWETKEKHKGKFMDVKSKTSVTYEMFYVNE